MTIGADIDRAVGRRLRLFRLFSNVAIADLARQLGIEDERIVEFEAGRARPKAAQLAELAVLLQVRLTSIFIGFDDDSLELDLANEIESALRDRRDSDWDFIRSATELFELHQTHGGIGDVASSALARARMLLTQRAILLSGAGMSDDAL